MDLAQHIKQWDGQSVSDLHDIYRQHSHSEQFFQQITSLCVNKDCELGATWLLKHHVECTGELDIKGFQTVLLHLPKFKQWQAQLHILQILNKSNITASARPVLEPFLRYGLSDANKLIRTWCFNGMYELAIKYPELQQEVLSLLTMAVQDEPASVKARIRKLLKKGGF